MKKLIMIAAAVALMAGCCAKEQIKVAVFNPLEIERVNETVELPWDSVAMRLPGIVADSVAVFDEKGNEIPSQVAYNGETAPQLLIFQATVAPAATSHYTVRKAPRGEHPQQAFGRYVPERLDDYAWENNIVAFRVYGPALADPITPGMDIWNKRTSDLVIDNWYKTGDYHHDHGQGMDCYKVGNTLGGGSAAPIVNDKLYLSGNYASYVTLDNGPIRTSVKLTYNPFVAGADTVSLVKYISLDANTRFSKTTNFYAGKFERLPIAAGMVIHNDARTGEGEGFITLTEPASDSKQPAEDGDISLAVIMPGLSAAGKADGHWLLVGDAIAGQPLVYWTGSGWSKNGIANDEAWYALVEQEAAKIETPLEIIYHK